MLLLRLFLTAFLIHVTKQLNNGLGLTPQMGTYSPFFLCITVDNISCEKDGTVGIILDATSTKILSNKLLISLFHRVWLLLVTNIVGSINSIDNFE